MLRFQMRMSKTEQQTNTREKNKATLERQMTLEVYRSTELSLVQALNNNSIFLFYFQIQSTNLISFALHLCLT